MKPQFRIVTLLVFTTIVAAIVVFYGKYGPGEVSFRAESFDILDGQLVQNSGTLIRQEDIVSVDWDLQEFEVREGVKSKVIAKMRSDQLGPCIRFEFCIDDEPLYDGTFMLAGWSIYPKSPGQVVLIDITQDNKFRIGWPSPHAAGEHLKDDLRFQTRIYNSLWAAGKLKSQ